MENNRWKYLKPKQSKDQDYSYEKELLELVNISFFRRIKMMNILWNL
jgi:hypothetical protein